MDLDMQNMLINQLIEIKLQIPKMKRKSISISEFEKKEITQATFKRNKEYLDYNKIQKQEKVYSIKRRQPYVVDKSPKSHKVNQKIQDLFRNSTTELQNKLGEEIKRYKQRVQHSPMPSEKLIGSVETGYQTTRTTSNILDIGEQTFVEQSLQMTRKTSQNFSLHQSSYLSQNKVRGIPIDKQISRDYLQRYSVERNNAVDQRNFNNFYIKKNDLSRTQDFNKLSPRSIKFAQQHITDLNYNTQKAYQRFYYSSKPMKTTFRFSLQKNTDDRSFFNPPRQENIAKTQLDPEKVRKSFTETSNFRPNKIDCFYKITGRELPHQLQQRKLSPNCNSYKDSQGKIIKQDVDYAVKKMYDDLIRKQKEEQYRKKNPQFTRDEICDQKYFNEIIKRENKTTGQTMQMRNKLLLERQTNPKFD